MRPKVKRFLKLYREYWPTFTLFVITMGFIALIGHWIIEAYVDAQYFTACFLAITLLGHSYLSARGMFFAGKDWEWTLMQQDWLNAHNKVMWRAKRHDLIFPTYADLMKWHEEQD